METIVLIVMILIGIYTVIMIADGVIKLKRGIQTADRLRAIERVCLTVASEEHETRRKLDRLEGRVEEIRRTAEKALWESLGEGEKLEPIKEDGTCEYISLGKLQDCQEEK